MYLTCVSSKLCEFIFLIGNKKGGLMARSKHWIWVLASEQRRSKPFWRVSESCFFFYSMKIQTCASIGRRLFEEFLKKEFSSENIQFWSAVEQLKNLRGGEKIFRQHVDVIFKIYINDTALAEVRSDVHEKSKPLFQSIQVSLDSKVKRNLMLKKDDPPRFLNIISTEVDE